MKPILHLVTLSVLLLICTPISSQVVFSDDFSDLTNSSWTSSGNLEGSAWEVYRSGDDWGARRNNSPFQLEISNDISGANNAAGFGLVTTSTLAFTSPYNDILADGGVVTWSFNMQQIRTDPSGFNSGNYGVAFILAGEDASSNNTGVGYAVVLGQAGATDPIRLVRYSDGIEDNSGLTNILVSNTSGLTDFGNNHLSIKVTYNPCLGGVWELFVRNDGSSFTDPLSGVLTSQGTATNNTHTGISLDMMAAYWQGSTSANQTAFFNNVTVSVEPIPTATLGANPAVCSGATSADLTYTNLTGGANQYDITWDGVALGQGFVNVDNAVLPASPLVLDVPGSATPDTYNGTAIFINSITGCESAAYPFTVTINPIPMVGCPNDTALCNDEPAFELMGGTPTGGTYTGTGVVGNNFDPALANPGINTITYSYTDINGCENSCTFDITVYIGPDAVAGDYGPACYDDPDIELMGTPSGGTWSGSGVTGNFFDPAFGTQTLTYTFTDGNGCTDADQTTITVSSCAAPSTMQWILLREGDENGNGMPPPCISNSDCDENVVCFGLEYTPLYTGVLTSYTTGFFMDCDNGNNPVVTNLSCVMNDNSQTLDFCSQVDSILFNSSGNSGGVSITKGIPIILHQVCFTIPSNNNMIITRDLIIGLSASIDSAGAGGFETDEMDYYSDEVVDSMVICAILPVRWLGFSAKPYGDLSSYLEWSTADEFNNAQFEIQRSQGADDVFRTIGQVDAKAISASINTYTFLDDKARPGKNYYRLKQVDKDGRFQYSSIKTVTFNSAGWVVDAWPNPAQDVLYIKLHQADQNGQIDLVDLSGRTIFSKNFEQGIFHHEVLLENLNAGVYVLVVTAGESRHVQKIVIVE